MQLRLCNTSCRNVASSIKDYPRTAFDVNIQGTFNVLEACVNNVKRLVYSSSASVYGDAVEVPMTEDHPSIIKLL